MVYTLLRSHHSHTLCLIWQMKALGDRASPPTQSLQARVSFSQRAPRHQETESIVIVLSKGPYHIMVWLLQPPSSVFGLNHSQSSRWI